MNRGLVNPVAEYVKYDSVPQVVLDYPLWGDKECPFWHGYPNVILDPMVRWGNW